MAGRAAGERRWKRRRSCWTGWEREARSGEDGAAAAASAAGAAVLDGGTSAGAARAGGAAERAGSGCSRTICCTLSTRSGMGGRGRLRSAAAPGAGPRRATRRWRSRKRCWRRFPDRVGRWRPGGTVLLSSGGSATMANRAGRVSGGDRCGRPERDAAPVIRLACAIEPEWLLDLFGRCGAQRRGVEPAGGARGGGERVALRRAGDRREPGRRCGRRSGGGAAGGEGCGSGDRAICRSRRSWTSWLARVEFAAGIRALVALSEAEILAALEGAVLRPAQFCGCGEGRRRLAGGAGGAGWTAGAGRFRAGAPAAAGRAAGEGAL